MGYYWWMSRKFVTVKFKRNRMTKIVVVHGEVVSPLRGSEHSVATTAPS